MLVEFCLFLLGLGMVFGSAFIVLNNGRHVWFYIALIVVGLRLAGIFGNLLKYHFTLWFYGRWEMFIAWCATIGQ